MKMLVFVISLGVLYWAMASFAQTRLAGGEACPQDANISTIGHASETGLLAADVESGEENAYQFAQLAPGTGDLDICAR